LEIGGYYIPWLDHFLDTLATPAAIVAGTVVTAAMATKMDPMLKWSLASLWAEEWRVWFRVQPSGSGNLDGKHWRNRQPGVSDDRTREFNSPSRHGAFAPVAHGFIPALVHYLFREKIGQSG
jgi:hypothetical protein